MVIAASCCDSDDHEYPLPRHPRAVLTAYLTFPQPAAGRQVQAEHQPAHAGGYHPPRADRRAAADRREVRAGGAPGVAAQAVAPQHGAVLRAQAGQLAGAEAGDDQPVGKGRGRAAKHGGLHRGTLEGPDHVPVRGGQGQQLVLDGGQEQTAFHDGRGRAPGRAEIGAPMLSRPWRRRAPQGRPGRSRHTGCHRPRRVRRRRWCC